MSAVINRDADALVNHFSEALRQNLHNNDLTLPTTDEELRAAAAVAANAVVESQRRLSERFGRFYTSETARGALHSITRQALNDRVKNHRLLRIETADGKSLYPELQFNGAGGLVEGLAKILKVLLPAATDEWVVLYWLTAPLDDFDGRTAADVLRNGTPAERRTIAALAKEDAAVWQDGQHGDEEV